MILTGSAGTSAIGNACNTNDQQQQQLQHNEDIQQLKKELATRSLISGQLRAEQSRLSMSQACRELYNYVNQINDPLVNTDIMNPYKKSISSLSNKVLNTTPMDKQIKHNVDTVMAMRNFNEMLALGLSDSRLELVLRNIKLNSGVNDIDRSYFNGELMEMAIQILRLLAKSFLDSKQQQQPSSSSTQQQQPSNISESKRLEIINKLLKIKDDSISNLITVSSLSSSTTPIPFNLNINNSGSSNVNNNNMNLNNSGNTQLSPNTLSSNNNNNNVNNQQHNMINNSKQLLSDLRLLWNDHAIKSIYSNTDFINSLPLYLKNSLSKYSIMDKVFGSNEMKKFQDEEIIEQILNPLNRIPEYHVINDIRISDMSIVMLQDRPMEKWMHYFSDSKALIWCCSLGNFDSTIDSTDYHCFNSLINNSNSSNNLSSSPPLLNYPNNNNNNSKSPILLTSQVNSLSKSIQLFKSISKQSNIPAIVIFTEKEVFIEKLKIVNFKSMFSDYKGSPKDFNAILEWIRHQFNPPNDPKSVTFHYSNLDGKEDIKVISTVLFTIVTQDVVDVFIN